MATPRKIILLAVCHAHKRRSKQILNLYEELSEPAREAPLPVLLHHAPWTSIRPQTAERQGIKIALIRGPEPQVICICFLSISQRNPCLFPLDTGSALSLGREAYGPGEKS